MSTVERVLVTGATGYIAQHCIAQLLQQGYSVRGTIRRQSAAETLRQALAETQDINGRLEFVEADLLNDAGWDAAAQDCTYVLHTASPLNVDEPKDENVVIRPALEGTRRVLQAAHKAGVKRVVMTSSAAAIASGHPQSNRIFDESDWSDLNGSMTAYQKSKTLAERAAWDFIEQNPGMELATINPVFVIGPSVSTHFSPSVDIISALLKREYPGVANLCFELVDVRDVAEAHLKAMRLPEAAGQRYLSYTDGLWFREIAGHLKAAGYRVTTRHMPDFLLRFFALFDSRAAVVSGRLGKQTHYNNEKFRQLLGHEPVSIKQSILDTASNMRSSGVV